MLPSTMFINLRVHCQTSYIDPTQRRAYLRSFEYVPENLRTRKSTILILNNSITKYLIYAEHQVDILES